VVLVIADLQNVRARLANTEVSTNNEHEEQSKGNEQMDRHSHVAREKRKGDQPTEGAEPHTCRRQPSRQAPQPKGEKAQRVRKIKKMGLAMQSHLHSQAKQREGTTHPLTASSENSEPGEY